jgi:hypothetical protein
MGEGAVVGDMAAVGLSAVALGFGAVGTISTGVTATACVGVGVGAGGTLLSQATSKKRLASNIRLIILFGLLIDLYPIGGVVLAGKGPIS